MFTLINFVGQVVGGAYFLLLFFSITLLYFVLCLLLIGKQTKKIALGWLVCEVSCDLLWGLFYFPSGEYRNPGIGGSFPLLLWPIALGITAGILRMRQD